MITGRPRRFIKKKEAVGQNTSPARKRTVWICSGRGTCRPDKQTAWLSENIGELRTGQLYQGFRWHASWPELHKLMLNTGLCTRSRNRARRDLSHCTISKLFCTIPTPSHGTFHVWWQWSFAFGAYFLFISKLTRAQTNVLLLRRLLSCNGHEEIFYNKNFFHVEATGCASKAVSQHPLVRESFNSKW